MDYQRLIWESHHHRFGLAGEGQADTIERLLNERRGAVLNLGCGPWGRKIAALASHCRWLIAVDGEIMAIQQARDEAGLQGVNFVVADAHALPFGPGVFDHVLALGLFAYIADPRPVFDQIYRVCRAGAHVCLTNAVRHPRDRYEHAANQAGLDLVHCEEGYCSAASGDIKRRYLLVFRSRRHIQEMQA